MPANRFSLVFALLCLWWTSACTYEAPPEVSLQQPQGGVFRVGDAIVLKFTDPVRVDSLAIRIWPGQRDIEGELLATTPHLDTCRVSDSPCDTTVLSVSEDRKEAVVQLDPADLGQPDVPLALEVLDGLANDSGVERGTAAWFDFQFKPQDEELDGSTDPIEFDSGVYMLLATVEEPIPTVLSLMMDIQVLPDGTTSIAGAEVDEIGDAPRNTMNPDELEVDTTDTGFAIFAQGEVRSVQGERFMSTDPFQIQVVIGPITVRLGGVRMSGIVTVNPETGSDTLEGTLSYETLQLDTGRITEYDPGSTTFLALFIPSDKVPEGVPRVCGDLCGAVTSVCAPPDGFPGEGFCEALAE